MIRSALKINFSGWSGKNYLKGMKIASLIPEINFRPCPVNTPVMRMIFGPVAGEHLTI